MSSLWAATSRHAHDDLQMPWLPNGNDLEATWSYLETGLNRIMLEPACGTDTQSFMGLYTATYNFCASGTKYQRGKELYSRLIEYLCQYLNELKQRSKSYSDEALLQFYIEEWDHYINSARYIHRILRFLNSFYVEVEINNGVRSVYNIYTLYLIQWRSVLLQEISGDVMESVLKLVEKHRTGDTIQHSLVKTVVDSFISLGLDNTDLPKSNLDIYRDHFERPFIKATRDYYQAESAQFLSENSVVEYMKKAASRLEEERQRVTLYLHLVIEPQLTKACYDTLISDHRTLFREEFQTLLENDREDDIKRMYGLLSILTDGLEPLCIKFETHVRNIGLAAFAKVATDVEKLGPKVYVDVLLETHIKFQGLVNRAFNGDPKFTRSLDNACREFVNRNDVCKSGANKSSQLLAKYTDLLLQKSGTGVEDTELEAVLTQIITVFKYIEDKDIVMGCALDRLTMQSDDDTEDEATLIRRRVAEFLKTLESL